MAHNPTVRLESELNPWLCFGCNQTGTRDDCEGSFRRRGVLKAHWECWSQCNLSCGFCYRTRGAPLKTAEARNMLRAVCTGGCTGIVFAGGDPSLRADINELVEFARELDLRTEIQTNADHSPRRFRRALLSANLIGLSIDASTPEVHDSLRGRVGNFERTLELLRWLAENGKPTIVRSVVLPQNLKEFTALAECVSRFENVTRWSILEFSPIGEGFVNREQFRLTGADFEMAADAGVKAWRGNGQVDIFRNEAKASAYLLLTPDGLVYGTTPTTAPSGVFPTVGSILSDHLADLASALPFAAEPSSAIRGIPAIEVDPQHRFVVPGIPE